MPLTAKDCLSCGAGLPAESLVCGYCGSSHVVGPEGAFQSACPKCGAGNPTEAKTCVQCRAQMLLGCPECTADNPLGSRFCHQCQIEFRSYRAPTYRQAVNRVEIGEVDGRVRDWLEGRWFKARDIGEKFEVMEKTLVWLPVWHMRCRVEGKVQGQVSQTHYRTKNRQKLDEDGKWVDYTTSEPYTIWNHVSKEFDQTLAVSRPAAREDSPEHYTFLGKPWAGSVDVRALGEDGLVCGTHERVFAPRMDEAEAFVRLHKQAEKKLRATLLEKVELLTVRWFGPRLGLTFYPVWDVLYRYKRSHGTVKVNGVNRAIDGKKITLLTQWFG